MKTPFANISSLAKMHMRAQFMEFPIMVIIKEKKWHIIYNILAKCPCIAMGEKNLRKEGERRF
jgi:hypothetical protein